MRRSSSAERAARAQGGPAGAADGAFAASAPLYPVFLLLAGFLAVLVAREPVRPAVTGTDPEPALAVPASGGPAAVALSQLRRLPGLSTSLDHIALDGDLAAASWHFRLLPLDPPGEGDAVLRVQDRIILRKLGQLARHLAPQGATLALQAGPDGPGQARWHKLAGLAHGLLGLGAPAAALRLRPGTDAGRAALVTLAPSGDRSDS